LFEFARLRREPQRKAPHDKHSSQLWDVAIGLELIGMVGGFLGLGRLRPGTVLLPLTGLILLLIGIAIRWSAILTLGKYFTGKVLIQPDQQLIRTGLYKYVRHPAYAGSLLAHVGLGLSFSSWFSLGFSVVPFLIAAMYRMRVEEAVLQDTFGVAYVDYSKRVKRLVPKLY
jgi:protein-S-isoprenylcysteine O-methyltransferase Ste14